MDSTWIENQYDDEIEHLTVFKSTCENKMLESSVLDKLILPQFKIKNTEKKIFFIIPSLNIN